MVNSLCSIQSKKLHWFCLSGVWIVLDCTVDIIITIKEMGVRYCVDRSFIRWIWPRLNGFYCDKVRMSLKRRVPPTIDIYTVFLFEDQRQSTSAAMLPSKSCIGLDKCKGPNKEPGFSVVSLYSGLIKHSWVQQQAVSGHLLTRNVTVNAYDKEMLYVKLKLCKRNGVTRKILMITDTKPERQKCWASEDFGD